VLGAQFEQAEERDRARRRRRRRRRIAASQKASRLLQVPSSISEWEGESENGKRVIAACSERRSAPGSVELGGRTRVILACSGRCPTPGPVDLEGRKRVILHCPDRHSAPGSVDLGCRKRVMLPCSQRRSAPGSVDFGGRKLVILPCSGRRPAPGSVDSRPFYAFHGGMLLVTGVALLLALLACRTTFFEASGTHFCANHSGTLDFGRQTARHARFWTPNTEARRRFSGAEGRRRKEIELGGRGGSGGRGGRGGR
jgi:hypothetical protein